LVAELENFDFDLSFRIAEFRVSTVNEQGKVVEATSNDNKFTVEQKKILNQCIIGQKVYFENIKAKGPDVEIRDIGTKVFTDD
jgi:hypothetical protein